LLPKTCERCPYKDSETTFYQPYDNWASKFVPEQRIKILFISESPSYYEGNEQLPYIYNPKYIGQRQYLLQGLANGLKLHEDPLKLSRTIEGKTVLLTRFSSNYFLLDATRCSVNQYGNDPIRNTIVESCSETFLYTRIMKLEREKGIDNIITIKANVHELLSDRLTKLFPTIYINTKLPFPSHGHQKKFVKELRGILVHRSDYPG